MTTTPAPSGPPKFYELSMNRDRHSREITPEEMQAGQGDREPELGRAIEIAPGVRLDMVSQNAGTRTARVAVWAEAPPPVLAGGEQELVRMAVRETVVQFFAGTGNGDVNPYVSAVGRDLPC